MNETSFSDNACFETGFAILRLKNTNLNEVRIMALIPNDPFRMLNHYWDEMERNYLRGRGKEELSQFLYRVDVEETSDQVYVTAEIPGLRNNFV